jgi:hypothetical protein
MKTNRLMLHRGSVSVYFESIMKPLRWLRKQNTECFSIKAGGAQSNHCDLREDKIKIMIKNALSLPCLPFPGLFYDAASTWTA